MRRRHVLAGIVAVGLAGCLDGQDASTPMPNDGDTPTQATELGTVEYTVTNEDDETYRLEVAMENAEGRVVQETIEPEFEPGERVSAGSAGHDPDAGPFTLGFRIDSASTSYTWDVRECARLGLQVTVGGDGALTVQRDVCQN